MDNRLVENERFAEVLSVLAGKIELLNNINQYDWNILCESIFIPILNKILNADLVNSNINEKNSPAIDLFDKNNRIFVQVTSTDNFAKIKGCIDRFNSHYNPSEFDTLYMLVLTNKAKCKTLTLSQNLRLKKILGHLNFDKTNILDFSDIVKRALLIELTDLISITEHLTKEVVAIKDILMQKGPTCILIFDTKKDIDIAKPFARGLIEQGVRVQTFSDELASMEKGVSRNRQIELITSPPSGTRFSIILGTKNLKTSIRSNSISVDEFGVIKNQHFLHLFVKLEESVTLREYDWIRPTIISCGKNPIPNAIEKCSLELRKLNMEDEIKEYNDFEKMIKHYDNRSHVVSQSTRDVLDRKKKIGYTFIETFLEVKAESSFYLNILPGTSIKQTCEQINQDPKIKAHLDKTFVFLTKDPNQKNLGEKLANVKKLLKCKNTFYLDEFIWKHCTDLVSLQLSEVEKFNNLNNFIYPKIRSVNGMYDDLEQISSWFDKDFDPVLIITGSGGIGKTTTARELADNYTQSNPTSKVLFIEASDPDVINELIRSSENDELNVYDFFKASFIGNNISQDIFRINLDLGNFLLIIDGLDEVFARINNFNIQRFIESIITDFNLSIGSGKVIITCRSSFWDSSDLEGHNIQHVEIQPFNESMARDFFNSRFNGDTSLVNKSMKLVASFYKEEIGPNSDLLPYTLDVVGKIFEDDEDSFASIEEESPFLDLENKNDYIIHRIFKREEKKSNNNISLEMQFQFFLNFAIKYNGRCSQDTLRDFFVSYVNDTVSENVLTTLKSHPLLEVINDNILFKYNFFDGYLKSIYMERLIKKSGEISFDERLALLLIHEAKYSSNLAMDIAQRFQNWTDDYTFNFIELIERIRLESDQVIGYESRERSWQDRAVGGLFNIGLHIIHKLSHNSIDINTNFLKDIFGTQDQLIRPVIYNLNHQNGTPIKFDFSDLIITDIYVENYVSFWHCNFNMNTRFQGGKLYGLGENLNSKSPRQIKSSSFINISKDSSFDDYFNWHQERESSRKTDLLKLLDKYFRIYNLNGNIRSQLYESIVKKRFTPQMHSVCKLEKLERALIAEGILTKISENASKDLKNEITPRNRQSINKFIQEGTPFKELSLVIKRLSDS